eukprot:TRINITY_DN10441_c0_g1_i1.p1 TRINITY_DN10441_c0_g1~~TRINITY_DN10441_c0_g1_i1.p1  ORF type:complete len:464 (-),score=104.30 TRINITY_DN10441_c0_g1_i1:594-1985(-)
MDHALLSAAAPTFVIAALAMPAGIGGGLLYVPLLLITKVVHTPNAAAALSQPIVVGAALAANVFNMVWQQRHPGKKLIHIDVTLAMAPPCLAGATLGTLLNTMLPPAVIVVLLLIVILWSLQNSLKKAIAMWKKESAAKSGQAKQQIDPTVVGTVMGNGDSSPPSGQGAATCGSPGGASQSTQAESPQPGDPDTPHSRGFLYQEGETDSVNNESSGLRRRSSTVSEQGLAEEGSVSTGGAQAAAPAAAAQPTATPDSAESSLLSWLKVFVLWLVILAAIVLRGGKGADSMVGIEMCSWEYWTVTAAMVVTLLLLSYALRQPQVVVALSFFVGILSSIVGIGGGLVLNPMLLSSGMDPSATTATVSVLILMSCSAAATMLALAGAIPLIPMLVLTTASFLGSLSGKTIIGWIVAKTGRTSTLVFLLAGFMLCSSSAIILESGLNIIKELSQGSNPFDKFSSPCA